MSLKYTRFRAQLIGCYTQICDEEKTNSGFQTWWQCSGRITQCGIRQFLQIRSFLTVYYKTSRSMFKPIIEKPTLVDWFRRSGKWSGRGSSSRKYYPTLHSTAEDDTWTEEADIYIFSTSSGELNIIANRTHIMSSGSVPVFNKWLIPLHN